MKVRQQSFNVWGECPSEIDDAILWIEKGGRVCYRSEDKIVEGSGAKFVQNIIARQHYSVIEHSNLVVRTKVPPKSPHCTLKEAKEKYDSKYLDFLSDNGHVYIGGNYRAWMELFGCETLKVLFTQFKHTDFEILEDNKLIPNELKRITVEFYTDRAVSHELVRHRPTSPSQESQRYVKYKKHIEFIQPSKFKIDTPEYIEWWEAMSSCETAYKILLKTQRAEMARTVLPNSTATRIVVTATIPEWRWIFHLRASKAAYPPMRELMYPLKDKFKEKGWI